MSTTAVVQNVYTMDRSSYAEPGDFGWFVAVESQTVTGWYGPISEAVAATIDAGVGDVVVGLCVEDHVSAHQAMCRFQPLGRLALAEHSRSWAIGAVDCAMWDAHGKAAQVPVAALVADGPHRLAVDLYASLLRLDLDHPNAPNVVRRIDSQGWLFTKWGLKHSNIMGNSGHDVVRSAVMTQLAAARPVAFDALRTWTPSLLIEFASKVGNDVVWVEDPCPLEDLTNLRLTSLLAFGEHLLVHEDPQSLVRGPKARALTLDVVGCGGITRMLSLVEFAHVQGLSIYPHGRSLMPGVHMAAARPDVVPGVEYQVQWEPRRQRHYEKPNAVSGAVLAIDRPGLGTTPRRDGA